MSSLHVSANKLCESPPPHPPCLHAWLNKMIIEEIKCLSFIFWLNGRQKLLIDFNLNLPPNCKPGLSISYVVFHKRLSLENQNANKDIILLSLIKREALELMYRCKWVECICFNRSWLCAMNTISVQMDNKVNSNNSLYLNGMLVRNCSIHGLLKLQIQYRAIESLYPLMQQVGLQLDDMCLCF